MKLASALVLVGMAPLLVSACTTSSTSTPLAVLGDDELEAITSTFAGVAGSAGKGSSGAGVGAQNRAPSDLSLLGGGVGAASWCGSPSLAPPYACSGGGDIYTTIDMSCSGPSGCCGANPACASDAMTFGGQGKLTHNGCRETSAAGRSIVIDGALYDGLTAKFSATCDGILTGHLVYTITGILSVRVEGHEVCDGTTMLTVTANVAQSVSVTVSGTICGQHVLRTYDQGCVVACGSGTCCAGGTVCSACSDWCVPAGTVDCCNGKHCAAGTRCVSGGDQCAP